MGIGGNAGPLHADGIDTVKIFKTDTVNLLRLDLSSERVHVLRSETAGEIRIHFHGMSLRGASLETALKDNMVTVNVSRGLGLPIEDLVLDIYLPSDYRKDLSINMTSGNIRMDDIALSNFSLGITSGRLEADSITSRTLRISTTSGNVRVKRIETEILEVNGSSAEISVEECAAGDGLLKTSSGGISIGKYTGGIGLNTTSGNAVLGFVDSIGRPIFIETTSGSVTLGFPSNFGLPIEVKTSGGGVHSDFTYRPYDRKNSDVQARAIVVTTSGFVNLIKK